MAANLEDQLIDKVRALPPDKQQEALRLRDSLATSLALKEQVWMMLPVATFGPS